MRLRPKTLNPEQCPNTEIRTTLLALVNGARRHRNLRTWRRINQITARMQPRIDSYTKAKRSSSATTTMVSRGGACLVKRDPVFSKDGKRLLVCTSCTVTVFSVQTGEVLTVLKGHKRLVTSVVVVPVASVCHCWTAGLDGTLRFWDFAAGVLLRTLDAGHPVQSMVIPELCKPREEEKGSETKRKPLVAFLSVVWVKEKREGMQGRVLCYNLTTKKQIPGHLARTAFPELLQVGPAGGVVGMVDDHKAWIWLVPQTLIDLASSVPVTLLHHTKRMSVLAFDTSETRVAAGDITGRILIWENVGDKTFTPIGTVGETRVFKQPRGAGVRGRDDASALTTHHWHAHEVKSLLFTIDGVYLLSGGLEGVLVIWQLESGKRNYLPRLGGQVLSIAPSLHPSLFAISCMDNSIKLLNIGTMDIERTIQGIAPDFVIPQELTTRPCIVSIDPVEGKVVVASHNMSLQFYDTGMDAHVAEVQVSNRNYGSDSRDGEDGPSTCVTHVAFSDDGACMATVDVRLPEQSVGGGSCLKFWDRRDGKLGFDVNTQVDEPQEISALSFRSGEMMAVSCSDMEFKVWVPYERRSALNASWRCRSVGSYRQRPILAAAFSPDGSILAVAASEFLTLWNPVTNGLIRVLANSVSQPIQAISHLAFVKQSHCLVAASSGDQPVLTVWDIATLSVRWCLSFGVVALTVDPVWPSFAVLGTLPSPSKKARAQADAVVALFDLESPSPKQYWTVRDGFRGALFFNPVPATTSSKGGDSQSTDLSKLTFLTSNREFVVFDPYQKREEEEEPEEVVGRDAVSVAVDNVSSSAFAGVYGNNAVQVKTKKDAPADVLSALSRAPWGTLLNGPSHVLPPLSVVAVPFMDSLLVKRKEQMS